MPHCLRLEMQTTARARSLVRPKAGSSIAARMAMMAMTTSNSISVKARSFGRTRCIGNNELKFARKVTDHLKFACKQPVRAAARDGEKTLGHGRRPAGTQGRLGKTAGEGEQATSVPALKPW